MARERERLDDRRIDCRGVGQRRAAEAGRNLGRPRAAADATRTLEHERPQAGLREQGRRDQAVMAAADHDDVGHFGLRIADCGLIVGFAARKSHVTFADRTGQSIRHPPSAIHVHPSRIRSAALRPGAPMIPPPGCVADPQMYKLRTGVEYCAHCIEAILKYVAPELGWR